MVYIRTRLSLVYRLMVYTCAVLLCLVCLFDLACFFLSSFSSLISISQGMESRLWRWYILHVATVVATSLARRVHYCTLSFSHFQRS